MFFIIILLSNNPSAFNVTHVYVMHACVMLPGSAGYGGPAAAGMNRHCVPMYVSAGILTGGLL